MTGGLGNPVVATGEAGGALLLAVAVPLLALLLVTGAAVGIVRGVRRMLCRSSARPAAPGGWAISAQPGVPVLDSGFNMTWAPIGTSNARPEGVGGIMPVVMDGMRDRHRYVACGGNRHCRTRYGLASANIANSRAAVLARPR